jgi:septal ring factor EnvC (AmiA/AmiB activator)
MLEPPTYGQTRQKRSDVTYAQIERVATDILKTGARPTIAGVREALGGGSPRTILDGLNRYWRDLGNQVAGTPDTLRRLPSSVADLAEGIWQRALEVAMNAAQATSTEAEDQLSRFKSQLEVRAHTLSQREIELDELLRARERTVKELEDNLRAALTMLTKRDTTISSLETRLTSAQQDTENHRQRLADLIQRAVIQHKRGAPKRASKAKRSLKATTHDRAVKRKVRPKRAKRQRKGGTPR